MCDISKHKDVNLDSLMSLQSDDALVLTATSAESKLDRENRKKREIAAKRRERMMSQMARMQRNFIRENRELFEKTPSESSFMSRDDSL